MAAARASNPYLKTKIMTASPVELRGMLLDGALRFARQGREGLASRDYEQAYNGIHRCQQILMELIDALDPNVNRELCNRLSGLYTFMYTRLIKAMTDRDPALADEVIHLLEYECETWRMAMDAIRTGGETGHGDGAGTIPPHAEAAPTSAATTSASASSPAATARSTMPESVGSLSIHG